MTTRSSIGSLQPIVNLYWRIVDAAHFRPGHSGYRDTTLHDDGGPNDFEALDWARKKSMWFYSDDADRARVGYADWEDRTTMLLIVEAATWVSAMDHARAATLLRLALDDPDAKEGSRRGSGAPGDPEHFTIARRASDDSVVARYRVWPEDAGA